MTIQSNQQEKTATDYLPYAHQYDDHTCGTVDGDITQTIRLAGVPFETMAHEDINALTRQWFACINNLGARNNNVALWTHLIRRKISYDLSGIEYDNWFSTELNRQYAQRLAGKDFYVIELYVSVVYRTAPGKVEKWAKKLPGTAQERHTLMAAGMVELDKIVKQLMVSLRRYHPTLLGTDRLDDGTLVSELARFYSRLLNGGESGPVAINHASVRYAIQRCDLHFGGEIIEIQTPSTSRYAGILGLKAPYGTGDMEIRSDLLRGLHYLPCEFDLSQSLTFLPVNKADRFLDRQIGQMGSAENNVIMINQLKETRAKLQAGQFGVCEHEFILTIHGDSIREVNAGINEAVAVLEARALGVIRERRGTLITQYFSRLPANFLMGRVRAMPIGTDNVSSFFPMHNFMTGNPQGSQWGMPLVMFETTSGAPCFVNYHTDRRVLADQGAALEYEEPEEDSGEKAMRKESGNCRFFGPNGSGKTVIQTFIRALIRKTHMPGKRPYKSFAFDADCGQEIFIRALGGRYFRFKSGEDTGIAPLALPDTPENRQFIIGLAQWCARQDETYVPCVEDEVHLQKAVHQIYQLTSGRRWARLLDSLPKGKHSLHSALGRWVDDGNAAWILDSAEDRLDLDNANDFGFDMTSFLGNPLARTPLLMCIMHKINQSAAGSPYSIDIDEASTALKDPFLQEIIENKARRIRKQDGVIGLSFQNAADVAAGALAPTLMNQFPTSFVFPNSSGKREDYPFLSDAEFLLVQQGMLDKPGKFLLKKGNESVVVCADLTGMNNMLAVLSGSEDNTVIARDIIARLGNDPAIWLKEFFLRRT